MTTYFNSRLLTQKQGQAPSHFAVFLGHSSPENHAFTNIDVVAEFFNFVYIALLFLAVVFAGGVCIMATETQIHSEYTYKYLFLLEFIYITNMENIMLIRTSIVIFEIGIECYVLQVKTR